MSTADQFDHFHDSRKHDSPSGSRPPLFEQNPSAYTIAALCCGIPIEEAAKLIEQYASMKACAAQLEEAQRIYARLDRYLS